MYLRYKLVLTGHKQENLPKLKKLHVMKAVNYFLAFIGGAAVGAACGLLFAPEKGADTRAMIVENLKKRGIKLSKKEMEDLASDIAEDLGLGAVE